MALAALAIMVVAGAVVGVATFDLGPADRWIAGAVATAFVLLGAATVMWAHHATPDEAEEEREPHGPALDRRRILLGVGAGAAVVTATAVAWPAVRRVDEATRRLRSTRWAEGVRAVDAAGELVVVDTVDVGDVMNIFPEGWLGDIDSQAVLIRDLPERFDVGADASRHTVAGLAAYSKLCTHMACPLGLYQQQAGTLSCPCHQAVFDVLSGGQVVRGPASRPLPQLPISVDSDGVLVARGDFTGAVGTGFWGRP